MFQDHDLAHGSRLELRLRQGEILPLIGIYDVFSGCLAARYFEAVFCSGYGLSASYYGLPDEGFIAWPDMLSWVERLRFVLPHTHIFVDIDDGYGDVNTATHVVRKLEQAGASAVIFEDQKRPKKCGHLEGKQIIPLEEYLSRLKKILRARKELMVVARTDATDMEEGLHRAEAFADAGADVVLVEGIKEVEDIPRIRERIGQRSRILVNLIAGGKTRPVSLTELSRQGVDIVNYSTPCLFAAQESIEEVLAGLGARDGKLDEHPAVGLDHNNAFLTENLRLATSRELEFASGPAFERKRHPVTVPMLAKVAPGI